VTTRVDLDWWALPAPAVTSRRYAAARTGRFTLSAVVSKVNNGLSSLGHRTLFYAIVKWNSVVRIAAVLKHVEYVLYES